MSTSGSRAANPLRLMSTRRRRLILAPEVRQDLGDILLASDRQWGKRQRDAYQAALRRGFEVVRDYPYRGVARDDVAPGLRSFPVEHHVIYHRLTDHVIEIARILHERMDAARHLRPLRQ